MPNITVINPFEVPTGKENEALAVWDRVAAFMNRQPGFVSAKLHRSIDPKARFHLVTVAEWASAEHFMAVLTSKDLQEVAKGMEAFPHYPGLYQVIRA